MSEEIIDIPVTDVLTLRRPTQVSQLMDRVPKPPGSVAESGLPKWSQFGLGMKVPMIEAPKGAIDFTRQELGNKLWRTMKPGTDFILYDPYCHEITFSYEPEHDHHLKKWLHLPENLKLLRRYDCLAPNGKVKCNLKKFNEYRRYLNRIFIYDVNVEQTRQVEREREAAQFERMQRESERGLKQLKRCEQMRILGAKGRQKTLDELKRKKERCARRLANVDIRYAASLRMKEDKKMLLQQKGKMLNSKILANRLLAKESDRLRKVETLKIWAKQAKNAAKKEETNKKTAEYERQKKLQEKWDEKIRLQNLSIRQEEIIFQQYFRYLDEMSSKRLAKQQVGLRKLAADLKKIKEDQRRKKSPPPEPPDELEDSDTLSDQAKVPVFGRVVGEKETKAVVKRRPPVDVLRAIREILEHVISIYVQRNFIVHLSQLVTKVLRVYNPTYIENKLRNRYKRLMSVTEECQDEEDNNEGGKTICGKYERKIPDFVRPEACKGLMDTSNEDIESCAEQATKSSKSNTSSRTVDISEATSNKAPVNDDMEIIRNFCECLVSRGIIKRDEASGGCGDNCMTVKAIASVMKLDTENGDVDCEKFLKKFIDCAFQKRAAQQSQVSTPKPQTPAKTEKSEDQECIPCPVNCPIEEPVCSETSSPEPSETVVEVAPPSEPTESEISDASTNSEILYNRFKDKATFFDPSQSSLVKEKRKSGGRPRPTKEKPPPICKKRKCPHGVNQKNHLKRSFFLNYKPKFQRYENGQELKSFGKQPPKKETFECPPTLFMPKEEPDVSEEIEEEEEEVVNKTAKKDCWKRSAQKENASKIHFGSTDEIPDIMNQEEADLKQSKTRPPTPIPSLVVLSRAVSDPGKPPPEIKLINKYRVIDEMEELCKRLHKLVNCRMRQKHEKEERNEWTLSTDSVLLKMTKPKNAVELPTELTTMMLSCPYGGIRTKRLKPYLDAIYKHILDPEGFPMEFSRHFNTDEVHIIENLIQSRKSVILE